MTQKVWIGIGIAGIAMLFIATLLVGLGNL